jgi:DNA mismatch endonuclease (patch repair protein)
MVDVLTPEQRRHCMSRVQGKNTTPEVTLRKALWAKGLRYRLNYKLPGKPDVVFVSARVAIFVDGCFWHGCPIHGSIPATNKQFWMNKLKNNIARDREVTELLTASGWLVLRFWTHELKDDLENVVRKITKEVLMKKQ